MRRFSLVICSVLFLVTSCGGSGRDPSNAIAEPDDLPQIMRDSGFKCGDTADTQAPNFYNGYYKIPHRKLDCNKGGDAGPTVRFFIWDEGEAADEASISSYQGQFCGTDQSPTYVVGGGWGATVTTKNPTKDAIIIDLDGMSELTDIVGGKVTSPFC